MLPSLPGRPRKPGFVSRGIRGNPEGLKGHIYAPIIPEPQHMGRPCAAVMTKVGGTDMKTPFPNDAAIPAIDLAKRSFQVCAATSSGEVLYNRKFTRPKLEQFLGKRQAGLVVMEACSTSHRWGRCAMAAGHEVRMIAPSCVKPFLKRVKNDAADAEAIATAVRQPGMRFVVPKSLDRQSAAILFKTEQRHVQSRAGKVNMMRSAPAEIGLTAPQGCKALLDLVDGLAAEPGDVPEAAQIAIFAMRETIAEHDEKIDVLKSGMWEAALPDEDALRIRTIPGIGPIIAAAFLACAPEMESFMQGRDFAAWLGLVPMQHSTGGKTRLGRIGKMGQSDMRRLLVSGAISLISAATRKKIDPDSWLARLLERMPRKKAAIAIANKMARMIWAVVARRRNARGI